MKIKNLPSSDVLVTVLFLVLEVLVLGRPLRTPEMIYDVLRKKTFIDMSTITHWIIQIHSLDRPLSPFGPSTFTL